MIWKTCRNTPAFEHSTALLNLTLQYSIPWGTSPLLNACNHCLRQDINHTELFFQVIHSMTLCNAKGLVFSYSEALMVAGSCCEGYVNLLYYALWLKACSLVMLRNTYMTDSKIPLWGMLYKGWGWQAPGAVCKQPLLSCNLVGQAWQAQNQDKHQDKTSVCLVAAGF